MVKHFKQSGSLLRGTRAQPCSADPSRQLLHPCEQARASRRSGRSASESKECSPRRAPPDARGARRRQPLLRRRGREARGRGREILMTSWSWFCRGGGSGGSCDESTLCVGGLVACGETDLVVSRGRRRVTRGGFSRNRVRAAERRPRSVTVVSRDRGAGVLAAALGCVVAA